MMYTVIPFEGEESNTNSVLQAQDRIRKTFPKDKIYFVPVAAFGIAYTAYIDNNIYENSDNWSMENQCGIIIYTNEDNSKTRRLVNIDRDYYIKTKKK